MPRNPDTAKHRLISVNNIFVAHIPSCASVKQRINITHCMHITPSPSSSLSIISLCCVPPIRINDPIIAANWLTDPQHIHRPTRAHAHIECVHASCCAQHKVRLCMRAQSNMLCVRTLTCVHVFGVTHLHRTSHIYMGCVPFTLAHSISCIYATGC